jgi:hypothetical protein
MASNASSSSKQAAGHVAVHSWPLACSMALSIVRWPALGAALYTPSSSCQHGTSSLHTMLRHALWATAHTCTLRFLCCSQRKLPRQHRHQHCITSTLYVQEGLQFTSLPPASATPCLHVASCLYHHGHACQVCTKCILSYAHLTITCQSTQCWSTVCAQVPDQAAQAVNPLSAADHDSASHCCEQPYIQTQGQLHTIWFKNIHVHPVSGACRACTAALKPSTWLLAQSAS